ncbi:MAG TPA: PAS domain-containing protein, partial [bacterium]|nr:PAS domain-containing protein [bacterium]
TGMIHEANPQAEVLMGYTRDELVGMHQTELHPREEMERYLRMFQERSEKGSGIDLDCEIVRKDSTKVPVMISAHLLAIGGKPYLMGIFRDQSLYKKMTRKKENAGRLEEFNSLALESAREGNQIVVSLLDKIRAQLGSGKLKDGSWELLLEAETELLKMKEVNRKLLSRNGEEES